jgi:dTDP-4-dehydrorhamnose reductase
MRIVIIGAGGQLGCDLTEALRHSGEECVPLTRQELDITDPYAVKDKLTHYSPDVILNCAVYHPVDVCEENPDKSFAVNAVAVRTLGLVADKLHAAMVHFSSDYIFDGLLGRPYTEQDVPTPASVFGVSKVAGEQLLRQVLQRHFIIRTSGLYGLVGSRVKRGNFVETMLRLGSEKGCVRVVNDLRMAQTSARNVARQVIALVRTNHYGTYHASDHGDYSWYEFALKIFKLADMQVEVTPTSWRELPAGAPRPPYSVLENRRLSDLGLDQMQSIDVALSSYLESRSAAACLRASTETL